MFKSHVVPFITTITVWCSFAGFGTANHGLRAISSICSGSNAWYYDGGLLEETKDICKPFTKYCYLGRQHGRYWQNYTKKRLDLDFSPNFANSTKRSSILHLNTTILSRYTLISSQDEEINDSPSDVLHLSLLKYFTNQKRWNATLAHVTFDLTNAMNELQFCVKQYPTTNTKSTESSPCDFRGFIPTISANQNYPLSHDQEITFIIKFDSHPKNDFYVFVYLGSRNILSSFVFHIDTQSVNHYQGNLAFKIERSVIPKPKVQFSSVFHTEGDSSNNDERNLLSFKKLFPEMYCPVKTETFCDLSESCINDTVPCRDKTGKVMLLKNDFKQNLINLDTIPVNRVEKITVVLSGKNVLLYPVIGHNVNNFIDILNISSENPENGKQDSYPTVGVLNNGPKIWLNSTGKCSVFSIIIVFSSHPNEWCSVGNQPKLYIAKDKQIILLGRFISNPKFWRSISVSGSINSIIRVKVEKRMGMNEDYPVQCNNKDFISFTNIGIVILVIAFAVTITGFLSNYFHRYSIIRHDNFLHGHHHGDYPGPEIENDIEINILHRKSSTHHSEYATKYSPIDFEHKNLKIPIEKEDILDEASNEGFEGVKVVNNIVYLED